MKKIILSFLVFMLLSSTLNINCYAKDDFSIRITRIIGGKGLSVDIINAGESIIKNINWTIDLKNYHLIKGDISSGEIEKLEPGEVTALTMESFFGFAIMRNTPSIHIKINYVTEGHKTIIHQDQGFLFLFCSYIIGTNYS